MLIFIVRNGELIDMQGGAIIIFKNDMEFGMKASRCIDIFELSKHDRSKRTIRTIIEHITIAYDL